MGKISNNKLAVEDKSEELINKKIEKQNKTINNNNNKDFFEPIEEISNKNRRQSDLNELNDLSISDELYLTVLKNLIKL